MTDEVKVALIGGAVTLAAAIMQFVLPRFSKSKKVEDTPKLIYHPLFTRMDTMIGYIEHGFTLENKGKEAAFKELLLAKFKIWRTHLYELAEEVDKCIPLCENPACNKLYNMNMEYFNKAYADYSKFHYNSNYTADEIKAMEIVISKFNKWHESRVTSVIASIEDVCSSVFYVDCKTRQSVIFDLYIGAFAETMNDASRTLNELNGDLNGLVIRGIAVGGVPHV